MKQKRGFGLIDMVLVVVTAGGVAAMSVPHLVDMSEQTQNAATASLAALLESASLMNFTKEKAAAMSGMPIADCGDTAALLEEGALPPGYRIAGRAISGEEGAALICTLIGPGRTSAKFNAIKVDASS